jgi:hypothetical protein
MISSTIFIYQEKNIYLLQQKIWLYYDFDDFPINYTVTIFKMMKKF